MITSLSDYFPIGRDIRELVARFNPRGLVQQSSFAWTGYLDKLLTYRVKGTLADFSIQADGNTPGTSGFTGTVEGNDRGGKFRPRDRRIESPDGAVGQRVGRQRPKFHGSWRRAGRC